MFPYRKPSAYITLPSAAALACDAEPAVKTTRNVGRSIDRWSSGPVGAVAGRAQWSVYLGRRTSAKEIWRYEIQFSNNFVVAYNAPRPNYPCDPNNLSNIL